jgi:hypothetical protein
VHAGLADFIAATGLDELIGRSAIHDHAARVAIQPTRAAWDLRQVVAIEVHHLVPGRHEVTDELLLRVRTAVDLGQGPEL